MRINWKLRLQNKTTLITLITLTAAIVYQVLAWFGVIPKVEMKEVLDAASVLVEILALLGIVVDPTTAGVNDSVRAMNYDEPNESTLEDKPELPDDYYEPDFTEQELKELEEAEEEELEDDDGE